MPLVASMTTAQLLEVIQVGQENDNYEAAVAELQYRYHAVDDMTVHADLRGGIRSQHAPSH